MESDFFEMMPVGGTQVGVAEYDGFIYFDQILKDIIVSSLCIGLAVSLWFVFKHYVVRRFVLLVIFLDLVENYFP